MNEGCPKGQLFFVGYCLGFAWIMVEPALCICPALPCYASTSLPLGFQVAGVWYVACLQMGMVAT